MINYFNDNVRAGRLGFLAILLLITLSATGQNMPDNAKLSPYLRHACSMTGGERRAIADGDGMVNVLAKLDGTADEESIMRRYHATVLNRIGRVLIVRLPMNDVTALAADDGVLRVEAERATRPMTDLLPGQISADKVQGNTGDVALPQAYTGKGVVVGIVDSGFDYINPFFRNANGVTRVTWAADYITNKKYTTPEAVMSAMHSSDAATMAHGTHVAGIAAGSRVNDINDVFYSGIARESDIAMGAVNSEITVAGLSSVSTIQAFSDIFNYADSIGKPCVINYSMGEAMSFTNNRQLEEEAIRTMLEKPGHILVAASGNAGGTSRLAHKPADMADGGTGVCFNDYEQYGTFFGIELKVKATQKVTLRYTNSNYTTVKGEVTKTVEELKTGAKLTLGGKVLTVLPMGSTADSYEVVRIGSSATFATTDRIAVTIVGEGDAWIYADPLCAQLENIMGLANYQLAEEGYSMAWPAAMGEVLTVGNIARRLKIVTMANKYASQAGEVTPTDLTPYESTKGEGYLAKSSSVGPTLSGSMKPDVCAPGVNIVSAQNFFINDDTYLSYASWDIAALDTEYENWGNDYGYFHVMAQTGTSMSSPAVAGTIALWLQADSTLTTERIKDIIAHSSRQPDSELQYPNNLYGHGEIDAYRGLLYMLGLTGIRELSQSQPQQTSFHLQGRQLTVTFAGSVPQHTLSVYSTDGRLLMTTHERTISLASLPEGVYAVQVTTGQRSTTGSTLIRL